MQKVNRTQYYWRILEIFVEMYSIFGLKDYKQLEVKLWILSRKYLTILALRKLERKKNWFSKHLWIQLMNQIFNSINWTKYNLQMISWLLMGQIMCRLVTWGLTQSHMYIPWKFSVPDLMLLSRSGQLGTFCLDMQASRQKMRWLPRWH